MLAHTCQKIGVSAESSIALAVELAKLGSSDGPIDALRTANEGMHRCIHVILPIHLVVTFALKEINDEISALKMLQADAQKKGVIKPDADVTAVSFYSNCPYFKRLSSAIKAVSAEGCCRTCCKADL